MPTFKVRNYPLKRRPSYCNNILLSISQVDVADMEEEFYGIQNERIVEEQNISLSSINVSKKLMSALEITIKSKYITLTEFLHF